MAYDNRSGCESQPGRGVGWGGSSSNTPPSNPQELEQGGEDMLCVSLRVRWSAGRWTSLRERLERCKEAAQAAGADGVPFEVEGCELVVCPTGKKTAGPYFRYRVLDGGIQYAIGDRQEPSEKSETPNVYVTAGSEACMLLGGAESVWKLIVFRIGQLGGEIVDNVPSRLDLCVDLAGQSVRELIEAAEGGQLVTRARARAHYWTDGADDRHGETLLIGKGAAMCCLYDKRHELAEKPNPVKLAYLRENRWGCEPERALRVEFRMRREFLKGVVLPDGRKLRTMEDYLGNRAAVVAYLLRWCRFVVSHDVKHPERDRELALWGRVRRAFVSWAGKAKAVTRAVKRAALDVSDMARQVAGCALSAAVASGARVRDFGDLQEYLADLVERVRPDWEQSLTGRAEEKGRRFGAQRPALVLDDEGAWVPCFGEVGPNDW